MTSFGDEFSSIPEIAYNFDKWLPEDQRKGRQVVPEPSTEQVVTFWNDWNAAYQRAREAAMRATAEFGTPPEGETTEQREDRMLAEEAAAQGAAAKLMEDRIAIVSAACSGTPSEDELKALPFRVRRGFEAYLAGKLGPEA